MPPRRPGRGPRDRGRVPARGAANGEAAKHVAKEVAGVAGKAAAGAKAAKGNGSWWSSVDSYARGVVRPPARCAFRPAFLLLRARPPRGALPLPPLRPAPAQVGSTAETFKSWGNKAVDVTNQVKSGGLRVDVQVDMLKPIQRSWEEVGPPSPPRGAVLLPLALRAAGLEA